MLAMISMDGDLALTVVAFDVQRMLWASHRRCVDQKNETTFG